MSLRRLFPTLSLSLLLSFAAACGDDGGTGGDPSADAGPDGDPDGGTDPGTVVEVCDTELAAPSRGACDVASGTGTAVMILGDVLAPEVVYENGAVVYDGDTIVCVGCDCADDAAYAEATRVTCPGAAVSPGLINAHDHITFSEGTPIDHGATRYDHRHEWRGSLSAPGNAHGTNGHRWGELRMLLSGVTSLNGSGTVNGGVRNLDRLQSHERDRGFAEANYETFPLGDGGEQFRADCGWRFKFDELEIASEPSFTPHVAEGVDFYAAEEFRCQSSSFDGARDFTERNTAHIHSIGLTTADYFHMARDGAQIIWSARTNIDLYGFTAAVQIFDRLGGTIALGTDWSYSGSANMLRELACVDQYNRDHLDAYFTDHELWQMATRNAAVALGNEDLLGSLEVGKVADLAVFAPDGPRYHRAVLASGNQDVELVVQSGVPMFGAQALVSGLGESCEPLDVCGQERAVCAEREYGESFAAIEADVSSGDRPAYAAIFCGVPAGEPSCVPARPGEFTGVASADDRDGDGLANADDNCPAVFNPPRPIDDGAQPDDDGDGVGDACDDTPLASDLDGDGVENGDDNCPFDANSDQADGDEDDKGDVCDPCPDTANPYAVCPAEPAVEVAISDIQDGTVAPGTRVLITDAVVTAVWSSGFWAQDPSGDAAYSGLHVFTGGAPGVAVGEVIAAEGEVGEYHGETQIGADEVTATGSATPIAPVELSAEVAATEPYEGVLVTITGAAVTDPAYDCAGDDPDAGVPCGDAGLWELDDLILVYDRSYQDVDWADQTGVLPVTGVMTYRYLRRRIQPRTSGDFGIE